MTLQPLGSLVTTCFSSQIHHCIFFCWGIINTGSVAGHISDDALCDLLQVLLTVSGLWQLCMRPRLQQRTLCGVTPGNGIGKGCPFIQSFWRLDLFPREWKSLSVSLPQLRYWMSPCSCYQTLLVWFRRSHVVYWKPHLWLLEHTFPWSAQIKLEVTSKE